MKLCAFASSFSPFLLVLVYDAERKKRRERERDVQREVERERKSDGAAVSGLIEDHLGSIGTNITISFY